MIISVCVCMCACGGEGGKGKMNFCLDVGIVIFELLSFKNEQINMD